MNRAIVSVGALVVLALSNMVAAQADHLEVLQAPQLVDCDPRPFFRLFINVVDADRKPIGVALNRSDPKALFKVSEGERQHQVIYVESSATGGEQESYSILLLDTSGSMSLRLGSGQMRFAVAKAAVRQSLASFIDGADHLAVIPFDSHNVAARIRGAEFQSTRRGLDGQLDAIPPPRGSNNTALFSAVAEALPILQERSAAGFAVSLVVFTDGENDVNHPGDDPGLLGEEGLAKVKDLAARVKVPITTVGFGVSGNVRAENALRDIAWPNRDNYYDAATNAARLTQIFEITRRKLTDRVRILFGPVRDRRSDLTAQSPRFQVRFTTADGFVASRLEPLWNAPGVGVPVPDATCTPAEAKAILNAPSSSGPPTVWNWERVVVLFTFAALVAGLWFGAPRLVWPESYIPKPTFQRPNMPSLPNVPLPPVERPRASNLPSPRASTAPPAAYPRPSRPSEPTIVVPARGQARPAPPPRTAPRAPEPPARDSQDETIYRPPDKIPGKDR